MTTKEKTTEKAVLALARRIVLLGRRGWGVTLANCESRELGSPDLPSLLVMLDPQSNADRSTFSLDAPTVRRLEESELLAYELEVTR